MPRQRVNRTPLKLDHIRLVPVPLQMGIWCKIVIKELNYWSFCSGAFELIDDHELSIKAPKSVHRCFHCY